MKRSHASINLTELEATDTLKKLKSPHTGADGKLFSSAFIARNFTYLNDGTVDMDECLSSWMEPICLEDDKVSPESIQDIFRMLDEHNVHDQAWLAAHVISTPTREQDVLLHQVSITPTK